MFLKNAWYVAATAEEVDRELKQIKVLGEKIVIYRTEDGQPAALEDACPHRKLPLSKGRLIGDQVECGYHGLVFNCSGKCTRVPGQDQIPSTANVRGYPTEERWGLVWIWMGNPDKADTDKIFPVEHFDDPTWGINRGDAMDLACNYLYMTDNLLDPSHVAWVHQTSFGNAACEEEPLNVEATDDGVVVSRWMMDVEPAPFYKQVVPFEGNCDRKQHYEVRYPSGAIIKAIFVPAGKGGEGKDIPENAFLMDSYNFMTPVDENNTRYYWFQLRNVQPDSEDLSKMMAESVRFAFSEDREVLAEVHKGMSEMVTPNINLAIDLGPRRFRQHLSKLIEQETA